jgi:hypothetical protein
MSRSRIRIACAVAIAVSASALALPTAAAAERTSKVNLGAQSDLRNLAIDEEIYLTDYDTYGSFSQIAKDPGVQITVHHGVELKIVHYDTTSGYCLRAITKSMSYMYDSAAGGLYPGASCRATKHGPSGGSRGSKGPSGGGGGKGGGGGGGGIGAPFSLS